MQNSVFKRAKKQMKKLPDFYQRFGVASIAANCTDVHAALRQARFERMLEEDDNYQKELAVLSFRRYYDSYKNEVSVLREKYRTRYIKRGLLK